MLLRKILCGVLLLSSFTLCLMVIYMGYKKNEARYKERNAKNERSNKKTIK